MRENVERDGEERAKRTFLIKKEVTPPYLERERRFEDTKSAPRPCAPQESHGESVCREIHINDSGHLREGCVLVERQMSDEGCLIRQR